MASTKDPLGPHEKRQQRAIAQAAIDGDAVAVHALVAHAEPPLTQPLAAAAFRHAFFADLKRGRVGAACSAGGIACAVFVGLSEAQHGEGAARLDPSDERVHGDNAVTVACQVSIENDDVRVLDALVGWDPHFRCLPLHRTHSGSSIEATAKFFADSGAPKCAARLRQRKWGLMRASKQLVAQGRARRALRDAAERALAMLASERTHVPDTDASMATARKDVLRDIVALPMIRVGSIQDAAFTMGFCVLGRPELVAQLAPHEVPVEVVLRLKAVADGALACERHEDADVALEHGRRVVSHAFLDGFTAPFVRLRKRDTSAYQLCSV